MATRTQALQASKGEVAKSEDKPKENKVELLAVPTALLLAAETIVSKAPKDRTDLQAVLIHAKDGMGRIVAADGFRYFIGAFEFKPMPSWMKTGIMLARDDLKARVSMIAKLSKNKQFVVLQHAKDGPMVMSDTSDQTRFQVRYANVKELPDYEQHIQMSTFTDLTEEAERAQRSEWEPVGFNSRHLRDCGEIAKILEAGLDKEKREANGMTIRVFDQGNPTAPRVFDFSGWDGALLIVGAVVLPAQQMPLLTSRVLEPAVKGTLAALRAHASRWRDAAAAASDEEQKKACLAKMESFELRVQALLVRAPEPKAPALPQPAAAETKKQRAAARAAKVLH